MIFSSSAARRLQGTVAAAMSVAMLALVASCGGSTSQFETFVPQRLLAFGDENSTITASGRSYSVNGLDSAGRVDCTVQPVWVQTVAAIYGFVFAECNPNSLEPKARMLAAEGTKVADLKAQIEAQVAAGGFRDTDIALVLAGMNDIIELYRQYPGRPESELIDEAGARGRQLAAAVNRLVDLGAKVIVSTLPDMGVSPYAAAERSANFDTDRAALMSRLSIQFNEQLGVNVLLDGRYVGLMQTDLRFQAAGRSPLSLGLVSPSAAVCTVAPPDCTTATLVDGANPSQWLWSDDRRLAPGGQALLASLALDRARRNPF